MPILAQEPDLYPQQLLEESAVLLGNQPESRWWAFYTRSRREKELMRRLRALDVPHYGPTIARKRRVPGRGVQISYIPLFSNYVFVFGDETHRLAALTTNCVSQCFAVADSLGLAADLLKIRRLIATGAPVLPEDQVEPGTPVRIRSGPLTGQEGVVVQRHGETRLVVAVRFLQRGASVLLEECEVEAIL
jgi:transcriptional antiterminator RfaH